MQQNEDLATQQRRLQRVDAARIRAFQDMVRTDGWKMFQDLLNGVINERMAMLVTRPAGADAVRGEDYDKGTCYALIWARDLPDVTIQAFKDQSSDPATEGDEG